MARADEKEAADFLAAHPETVQIQAFLNPWIKYFCKEKDAYFSELSMTALLT